MRLVFYCIAAYCCIFLLGSCGKKQTTSEETRFTKEDSVTDRYLAFEDSILKSWNIMINDDNQKINAMHNLLHELMISHPEDRDNLAALEERLDQLKRMRYTQKSMSNADVIEEYDFASNSLVSELISLAESKKEFAYNTTLQKLVDDIRSADQRVDIYRLEYDSIVMAYNKFLERNQTFLKEVDAHAAPEKRPLFQMVSEE
jgi:septal ring factor EnvC (AmiA/AmiB activator)